MATDKVNLMNYDRAQLARFFASINEKSFRANQVSKWIHQEGITDFDQMLNLSKALREKLKTVAEIIEPKVSDAQYSKDGTCKWLVQLDDNNCVETVFIPEGNRGTLCVSSQIGCGLTCSFCSTAKQGFNRNLTLAEIIGQVWVAVQRLAKKFPDRHRVVTNVVMMGMGEPLLNYDAVVSAMNLMMDDFAYGLSKYRVTLSTSGLVKQMEQLKVDSVCALAVSLHAPFDELRNELVPINKKYPLEKLMETCRHYFEKEPRRQITFEYVMLAGVNDQPKHSLGMIKLLEGIKCKINLIPFNPFPNTPYHCSDMEVIKAFQYRLVGAGFNVTVRKTRGDDIDAACGQLAGKVNDRTSRQIKWREKSSRMS